ncbi:MAG: hypothetical protein M3O55_08180 [Actinomycetota bacterium]|nr:hypothetical protein [Actinomycetota bacterium]
MSLLDRLRRGRPPPEVASAMAPHDRLLAWAPAADGFVVASRLGLRLPDGRSVPWHTIDKAAWRAGRLTLTVAEEVSDGVLEALPPATYSLTEPRDLPAVVRGRVTHSVAYTSSHAVPGGGHVRVVARRVPGHDGLTWSLRIDPRTGKDDPSVRAAANQLLAEARGNFATTEPG